MGVAVRAGSHDGARPTRLLISDDMARFARRHGLDHARGVAINEVMVDGSPASGPRPNG